MNGHVIFFLVPPDRCLFWVNPFMDAKVYIKKVGRIVKAFHEIDCLYYCRIVVKIYY